MTPVSIDTALAAVRQALEANAGALVTVEMSRHETNGPVVDGIETREVGELHITLRVTPKPQPTPAEAPDVAVVPHRWAYRPVMHDFVCRVCGCTVFAHDVNKRTPADGHCRGEGKP